ncbi:MAG: CapA family protein, partial [Proteobacteria bacterium]|nr:CapA family protein [Pseudomonadota bacterium]
MTKKVKGKKLRYKLSPQITAALILICHTFISANSFCGEGLVIYAVGDIMPSEKASPFIKKHGHGYPYKKTRKLLQSGDIVIGNLETPLTVSGSAAKGKQYVFKSPPETAGALKEAGFTHMSLANNHMMDYGPEGLESTVNNLESAGLHSMGAGKNIREARRPELLRVKGKKVALLAYSNTFPKDYYAGSNKAGTAPGYTAFVKSDILKASKISDFVITSFHWGAELMDSPKEYQKELARLAIDSGADLVLGHHPHILQGVEFYKEGVIFYSLGNFSFAAYSKNAKESIIARITIGEKGIDSIEAIPINVDNFKVHFQPEVLEGARAEAVLSKLN